MKTKLTRIARQGYAILALAVAAVGLLPMLTSPASAFGQVTSRSIKMSSSKTSNTNTSYLVTFTPAAATIIQGVAVDFCSNNPLIGNSCTAPTGFSVGTPTITGFTITGQAGGGTFTPTAANSNRTLLIDNSTTQTGTPTLVSFTLTTATNPSTLGTFYARIFTFANTGDAATWAAASGGNGSSTTLVVDAGGVALSTVTVINITANVMEQITFCTSGLVAAAPPTTCASVSSPDITIGHGTGTLAIDSTATDTASTYALISTNASSGAIVRMKSSNTCTNLSSGFKGGLSKNGGTTCAIEGVNSGATTPTAITPGAPSGNPGGAFGMCVLANTANTVASTPYQDPVTTCGTLGGTSQYGMDDGANGVTSTYGSQIYTTNSAPCSNELDTLKFAATASLTTPAGIYTATEQLIATGTF